MSIVLDRSNLNLTVIIGGLSESGEGPTPPIVSTTEQRVQDYIARANADIELWEALAFVARQEEFLGRECDAEEIESAVCYVMHVQDQMEKIQRVLAGAGHFAMLFDDPVYVDRTSPRAADWLKRYETERRERCA